MGVVITRDDIIAYAEVDYIIHHMNEKYIRKIPEKLLNFFGTIKDPNHVVNVNPRIPLQNQNLKKYTLEIIALLHIKYWCEDEERRKMLYEKMLENQRKLDEQMREKFNNDNLFDMNSAKVVRTDSDLNSSNYSSPKNYNIIQSQSRIENSEMDNNEPNEKLNNYLDNNNKYMEVKENSIIYKGDFLTNMIIKIKNLFSRKK
ncbi:MAG: hypothetical protein IKM97_05175 [Clostridia bacterium]|nr:hypothetical protein [Clostridia bacterium]